jgi:hypothetical protein
MEIEPEPTRGRESDAFAGATSISYGGCLLPKRITNFVPKFKLRLQGRRISVSVKSNVLFKIDWFWTSEGKALAYREADGLFSCEGRHIGHFKGDEIYGREGNYLGEIAQTGRLVTRLNKLRWRRSGFFPSTGRRLDSPADVISEDMAVGFRDFKIPR